MALVASSLVSRPNGTVRGDGESGWCTRKSGSAQVALQRVVRPCIGELRNQPIPSHERLRCQFWCCRATRAMLLTSSSSEPHPYSQSSLRFVGLFRFSRAPIPLLACGRLRLITASPSQRSQRRLSGIMDDTQAGISQERQQRRQEKKDRKQQPRQNNAGGRGGARGGGGGGTKGGGSSKLRGLPKDSHDVRISKTLSWILRHGSQSEGLAMRPDGFVRVDELVRFSLTS